MARKAKQKQSEGEYGAKKKRKCKVLRISCLLSYVYARFSGRKTPLFPRKKAILRAVFALLLV
jgi:hypothetical protein